MHRYKNGFGDYHYEYLAVYGVIEILDCILEVAALVICALISWKQREEIKKNRQELSSVEMPVSDGINNENNDAMKPEFTEYQKKIVENAATLAKAMEKAGFRVVSGGTDNHLMLIDLRNFKVTGKEMQARLDAVHITVNKNAIPDDPQSPFITSGVRVGTPALTTRGMKEPEMKKIAHLFALTARDFENSADAVRAEVAKLCEQFPLYKDI